MLPVLLPLIHRCCTFQPHAVIEQYAFVINKTPTLRNADPNPTGISMAAKNTAALVKMVDLTKFNPTDACQITRIEQSRLYQLSEPDLAMQALGDRIEVVSTLQSIHVYPYLNSGIIPDLANFTEPLDSLVKLWGGKHGSSLEITYSPSQSLHGFDLAPMCLDIASANCSAAYFSARYAHPP